MSKFPSLTSEAKRKANRAWAQYAKTEDRAAPRHAKVKSPASHSPSPLSDPVAAAKARRAKFAQALAWDAFGESHAPWWYGRNRPLK
jgi:hypothetical protein